jgi:hypothetical protein
MSQAYQVTGEMTDSRHVTLDQAIPVAAGKVRVIVERIPPSATRDLAEFERQLRERQKARGHVPPSKEEIDAYLKAERESWDS